MKTRIVMWGNNEKDEKVLIAISLRAEDNVVDIFTSPLNRPRRVLQPDAQ
jgi:hypothetical protein